MNLGHFGLMLLAARYWNFTRSALFFVAFVFLIALIATHPKTLFFIVPLLLIVGYQWRKFHLNLQQELDEYRREQVEQQRKQEEKMKTKYVIIRGEDNWKKHYQPKE